MTSQMVFEEFERYPFSDDPEFKVRPSPSKEEYLSLPVDVDRQAYRP